MFRVYAHIYFRYHSFYIITSHLDIIRQQSLYDQFKFSLCHFLFFVDQFKLVSYTDLLPLRELITQLAPNLRCSIWNNRGYL